MLKEAYCRVLILFIFEIRGWATTLYAIDFLVHAAPPKIFHRGRDFYYSGVLNMQSESVEIDVLQFPDIHCGSCLFAET